MSGWRVRWDMIPEHAKLADATRRLENDWPLTAGDRELLCRVLNAVCQGENVTSRYYERTTEQPMPPQQFWIAMDYHITTGSSRAKEVARRWGIVDSRVRAIYKVQAKHFGESEHLSNLSDEDRSAWRERIDNHPLRHQALVASKDRKEIPHKPKRK